MVYASIANSVVVPAKASYNTAYINYPTSVCCCLFSVSKALI